jgi:ASC-1-like (ASCH) protein
MNYKKNLSEPWFSLIGLGIKKYEGRLNKGDFSNMKKGDILIFENNDFGYLRKIQCIIQSVKTYVSFREFLEKKTLKRCLPGIDTLEHGEKVYYKYYSKNDETKYKIVGIKIKLINI